MTSDTLNRLLDFFTTALAIIIVCVPEGLPLAVSISMAFSVDTMKKENLLVKNLDACETMGIISNICTGKTATLTKNDMKVNAIYSAKNFSNVRDSSTVDNLGLPHSVAELIKEAIILNNDCSVEMTEDGIYLPVGNGIEAGMLKFLQQSGIEIHDRLVHKSRHAILETYIPFCSKKKRQLVAYRTSHDSQYVKIIIKGAPELILPMCKNQFGETGHESAMPYDEQIRVLEQEVINKCCKKGLKTIAYAFKDVTLNEWNEMKE